MVPVLLHLVGPGLVAFSVPNPYGSPTGCLTFFYTPEHERLEPKNHYQYQREKDNHLNQTSMTLGSTCYPPEV